MKTPKTAETIKHFIEALEHPARELTGWEQDFFLSVADQFDRRGDLSERQFEVLERIYAEKTA